MSNKIDIAQYKNKDAIKAYLAIHGAGESSGELPNEHFFLGGVPHTLRERLQINSGSDKKVQVLAFDPIPEIINITGYLLAYDGAGDWVRDFRNAIEKEEYSMRSLIKADKHIRLYYSNRWIKGYILGVQFTEDPDSDPMVAFNMEWLVLDVHMGEWNSDLANGYVDANGVSQTRRNTWSSEDLILNPVELIDS